MRVAMFASNYPPHPGGLEVAVSNLANGLARRHEVVVVTTAWAGRSGLDTEGSVRVLRLPAFHATERAGVPYPVPLGPGIRAALREVEHAHVVHAHGALYATTVLAARDSRARKRPFILTEHVGFVAYKSSLLNRMQRSAWSAVGDRTIARAAAVVTYNSRVADWLRARYPGKAVEYIGNGVDTLTFRPRTHEERIHTRRSLGLPTDGFLALFVGRDTEKKNLDAVLSLPRDAFSLVVCGATRGLTGDGLIDLGVVEHARMAELYASVDVMLNVSRGEGFPLALQEALATGLPVILLWDEGYGESLDRSVPFTIGDQAQLAAALNRVKSDGALRGALSTRARDWATRNWSWSNTIEAYERVYEAAIHGSSTRSQRTTERRPLHTAS